MSGKQATTALRAVSGIAVLALAGGAVAAAALLPRPAELVTAPLAVEVPPTEVALACPALVMGGEAAGSDAELGGASDVTGELVAGALAGPGGLGEVLLEGADTGAAAQPVPAGENAAVAAITAADAPSVLRGGPTTTAAFLAAALTQRATTGDLRGLAAAACPAGTTTAWFAAGATTVGDSTTLLLTNVGSTPATVQLRAWGETGEVPIDRAQVVVAPGETAMQALEALVPDVSRLALSVTSRGGTIAPLLRTAALDGLTAAGFDFVAATGGPATEAVVPGVVLGTSSADDEGGALVRVLNPGSEPAEVELELLGEDSITYLGGLQTFVVDPGVVADVTLAGAPAGDFAIRATSATPIVVGALLVRPGAPDPFDPGAQLSDRAWLSSVPPAPRAATAVPGLGSLAGRAVLSLVGSGAQDVVARVAAVGSDGGVLAEVEVPVPADTSVVVDVAALDPATALLRVATDGSTVGEADAAAVPGASGGVGPDPGISGALVLSYADELGDLVSVLPLVADPQVERTVRVALTLD